MELKNLIVGTSRDSDASDVTGVSPTGRNNTMEIVGVPL